MTTDTPLTGEQIDQRTNNVRDAVCRHDYASPAEFDRWLDAIEARAARQERRRLWHAIDPLIDGVHDRDVVDRLAMVGTAPGLARAYRLGVSTALMETAKEPGDD